MGLPRYYVVERFVPANGCVEIPATGFTIDIVSSDIDYDKIMVGLDGGDLVPANKLLPYTSDEMFYRIKLCNETDTGGKVKLLIGRFNRIFSSSQIDYIESLTNGVKITAPLTPSGNVKTALMEDQVGVAKDSSLQSILSKLDVSLSTRASENTLALIKKILGDTGTNYTDSVLDYSVRKLLEEILNAINNIGGGGGTITRYDIGLIASGATGTIDIDAVGSRAVVSLLIQSSTGNIIIHVYVKDTQGNYYVVTSVIYTLDTETVEVKGEGQADVDLAMNKVMLHINYVPDRIVIINNGDDQVTGGVVVVYP